MNLGIKNINIKDVMEFEAQCVLLRKTRRCTSVTNVSPELNISTKSATNLKNTFHAKSISSGLTELS